MKITDWSLQSSGRSVRVVVVLVVIVDLVGALKMQRPDPSNFAPFEQVKLVLSKLFPVEKFEFASEPSTLYPFAPRICWKFFRPDPSRYKEFVDSITSYRGPVKWIFGPKSGDLTCLVAMEKLSDHPTTSSKFVGYPPDVNDALAPSMNLPGQVSEEFKTKALADIKDLARYLSTTLKLEATEPKKFTHDLIAPKQPPFLDDTVVDFIEPGINVLWIVEVPQSPDGTSPHDVNSPTKKRLHFGVTESELSAIINLNKERSSILLSRLHEHDSSYFNSTEIGGLKAECILTRKDASSIAARGLDKIMLACNWASHLHGGISLVAP